MNKDFAKDIENCLRVLHEKGSILYPTDTVWGLGCDATNEEAVQKIIQIKNRPANKSFVVLADNIERLEKYVSRIDEKIMAFLSSVKKPVTVIYPNVKGFAESVAAPDSSVAIRICKDDFCKELIGQFGKPILSTSANKSGEPTPRFFSEINKKIINEADYTVQYRQNEDRIAAPSTIVKWEKDELKIIRD